jgi:hypothetical protein
MKRRNLTWHYPGWQCWIGGGEGCLRYITKRDVILTLVQWLGGRLGGLDLLTITTSDVHSAQRGLLLTADWEVWSLFWFILPAQLRAMGKGAAR